MFTIGVVAFAEKKAEMKSYRVCHVAPRTFFLDINLFVLM